MKKTMQEGYYHDVRMCSFQGVIKDSTASISVPSQWVWKNTKGVFMASASVLDWGC